MRMARAARMMPAAGKLVAARRFQAEEQRQAVRRDDAREQAGAAIQRDAVGVLAAVQVDPGPEQVEAAVEHADEQRGEDQRAGEEGGEPRAELERDLAAADQRQQGGHAGQGQSGDQGLLVEIPVD